MSVEAIEYFESGFSQRPISWRDLGTEQPVTFHTAASKFQLGFQPEPGTYISAYAGPPRGTFDF